MKKLTGLKCLLFALIAFSGLGIEVLLALVFEPIIFGVGMDDWSVMQNIIHWTVTCICWGIITYFIFRVSKKKYGFDLLEKTKKMKKWQIIIIIIILILNLVYSYIDWNGSKVLKEFQYNGLLKFIFQYIYYLFEVMLVTLIVIFGQKAFEKWFKNEKIPYGSIMLALTWGMVHFLTKGISTGIGTTISSLIFGEVYLLTNRNTKKTYLILLLLFVL